MEGILVLSVFMVLYSFFGLKVASIIALAFFIALYLYE